MDVLVTSTMSLVRTGNEDIDTSIYQVIFVYRNGWSNAWSLTTLERARFVPLLNTRVLVDAIRRLDRSLLRSTLRLWRLSIDYSF